MKKLVLLPFFFLATFNRASSQVNKLTQKEINETLDSLYVALEQNYFDTSQCRGLIHLLQEISSKGIFLNMKSPGDFEMKLDSIIRSYTNDDHFKVVYDEQWVTENSKPKSTKQFQELLEFEKLESKKKNYGFQEVKILGGNIGYLKFSSFENPEFAASTLASSMSFLQNTDAIILDLRNNTGGYTEMMALVCSYFLNTNEDWYLPLTEMRLMKNGKKVIIQNNALGAVGSTKMLNSKLYILTNYRTFSAAEWTSFVLKIRKRAIIVGEKTAGGTHPTNQVPLSKKFSINIPIGTMVEATTYTHFEGIGVMPDIEVPAAHAHIYAQIDLLEKAALEDSTNKQLYEWHLLSLKSQLKPVSLSKKTLATYEGKYGNIELKLIGETLYSIREGIKTALTPLTAFIFKLEGRDDLRIRVIVENNTSIAIERLLENGTTLKTGKQ